MYEFKLQLKNGDTKIVVADGWIPNHEAIVFVLSGVEIYRVPDWKLLVNMKRRVL